jgi:hypothetical protein
MESTAITTREGFAVRSLFAIKKGWNLRSRQPCGIQPTKTL